MHVQTSWIKQKPTKKYETKTGKRLYYFSEDHANTEKQERYSIKAWKF